MDNSSDSDWDPPESSDDEAYGFVDEPDQVHVHKPRIPLLKVDDIRIFTIDRSAGSDTELTCHFQRISVSNPPPYCALSYAWGEIKDDGSHLIRRITVDGVVLKITETLYRALVRIREMQSDNEHQDPACEIPALWVDAICINQDDPIERSRQVMMMGQIFASAFHLLVWLGEDLPYDTRTTQYPVMDTNSSLLRKSYFTRMWVVQEAICASSVQCTLMWNGFRIPISNLVAILDNREMYINECYEVEKIGHKPDLDTLMMNLLKFWNKRCSDKRDRIYALRSISRDGQAVTIDYSQTCESLYTALAVQWIQRGHLLAILLIAGLLDREKQDQRVMPSWIPDWRLPIYDSKNGRIFLDTVAHIIGQASLHDSHHSNATYASPVTSKDGLILEAQGWLIPACGHYVAPLRNTTFMYLSIIECVHCYMVQTDSHYSRSEPGIAATTAETDTFFIPDYHERYVFRLGAYDSEQDSHILLHPLLCPWHDVKGALAGASSFKPTLQTVRLR